MNRYILTDAGNVLATFKFRAEFIREIMKAFGVNDVNLPEVFRVPNTFLVSDEAYYHGLDIGEFSVRDIYNLLVRQHALPQDFFSYHLFFSLWCRHLEPIKEVVKLQRSLQEKFPLVLVSNGDSEGVRHLVYYLMVSHSLKFKEVFISAERKCKKPKLLADIVAFLLDRDVAPSNCVFIDDLLPYCQAAQELGIPVIHFNGAKQPVCELKKSLEDLGFSNS